MSEVVKDIVIAEEDLLRADLYDFLAALLANAPDSGLLQRASSLGGDDSALGQAISTLARVAKAMKEPAVEREFNALFIGLGRGELMPFASYYLTGFLNEKPLATLRADMAGLRITRAPNVYEPEDNIASLLEMMAGMIRGRFGEPTPLTRQKDFYFTHIAPWAEHFFTDLEGAQNSVFYAPVGTVGKAFLEIETQAFRMGAE
ncbi:molecular chaperone TorD family protein [Shimia sp. R9_3]|uniref:TorD/DmsD family molecular chaperone n=1 Tax=Shimia sp. R9_3 TaxID=2821113 RepID=UPI001ADBADA5|nr:molecular chaperone TorD family protein [Shimia sp. R9_3]MBO9399600.1 molecular chaperone TorD family protein [Shimia sp. R9_3]